MADSEKAKMLLENYSLSEPEEEVQLISGIFKRWYEKPKVIGR